MRWWKKLKVLRCYLFIVGWLGVLLLCLSYWKIDSDNTRSPGPMPRKDSYHSSGASLSDDKPRHRRPRTHCNAPEKIKLGHEGEVPNNYELAGVIIVMRHGDRGPLISVKNFSSINCGYKSFGTPPYKHYVATLLNASKTNTYINFVGPFMKYPIIPPPVRCSIGHLTPLGISQHLQLGKILKSIYLDQLGLLSYPWELDDIVVYSTKYRRTFQSVLAFVHSFLPVFDLSFIKIKDAKGVTFCEDYCKCDKATVYDEKHDEEKKEYRKSHPSIVQLITDLNPLVKASDLEEDITSPYVMRDALLAYACHGSKLPCKGDKCVNFDDLSKLLSFEEWEAKQKRTSNQVKSSKLKSYGHLKNIFGYIDGMMVDGRPKVVIYSGHDKTLNYLLTSLGVSHFQTPYCGSRVIFEVYHNTTNTEGGANYKENYHFRLIYNGKDVTKQIPFCNVKVVKQVDSGNIKMSSMSLCPVGSFEKFIKPSFFFKEFNASSFTAACVK